ncbi:hypothetical protein MLD38_031592 [Melastoma candidum]|uniref:Uncharacterized protein n=1 Tax=Melastoma candidum TaxID=119954 RepID=A0ACB9MRD8_9MYRT|nr:hypothetical protein MLD38_031592 [Melastoma candidum]
MTSYRYFSDGDEEEEDDDSSTCSFDEDMDALRRACLLSGTSAAPEAPRSDSDSDSNDLEVVRRLQLRFSNSASEDLANPLPSRPLMELPSCSDGEEDDFETLRAIQSRFAAYDQNKEVSGATGGGNFELGMPINGESEDASHIMDNKANNHASASPELQFTGYKLDGFKYSSFPKAGRLFIDAIKKNRSYQKLLRSKLIEIEARIEEIKKLRERVQILKDFQVSCRKRTGRALSQKKDARFQLITARRTPKESKVDDRRISAMCYGPVENSHVVNYRLALEKYPLVVKRKSWSEKEKENLGKGIKQQFQELLLQISLERFSTSEGDYSFEDILESIKDLEIPPENFREFLPKVRWDQLASMYMSGRTGSECEARWLNWEDPLINHKRWTVDEDKQLLNIIQLKGINNWFDMAVSLGTYRTPFQCLARYQRSLNVCIMKREWTPDDDAMLRAAVETHGCRDWQAVAFALEGRTGNQCSNRWNKTLHPNRLRTGRWDVNEDQRLKVAVMLFGPTNWRKISDFVPGRTHVQCRERWVNSLDPSLNWNAWTVEEDAKLEAAIAEHGYCWSRIAACIPPRTDNQCRRRWKNLFPNEVPLLRAARNVQKAALVSNFVDRENERPALGPNDFLPLPMITFFSEPEQLAVQTNHKHKTKLSVPKKVLDAAPSDGQCNSLLMTHDQGSEVDTLAEISFKKKRNSRTCTRKKSRDKHQLSSELVPVQLEECSVPGPGSLDGCDDDDIPIASLKKRDRRITAYSQKARKRKRADEDRPFLTSCQDKGAERILGDLESTPYLATESTQVLNESRNLPEPGDRQHSKQLLVYTRKSRGSTSITKKVPESEAYDVPLSALLRKRRKKMISGQSHG